ncbi:helix-turn-helix domain-containing protein [Streptomyces sp. NPDC058382]|uniref:helix-turn-helix domain-containing protein n=1 Tax=unclassified Streptomyces TaxID=2593676 RepID=UPI0036256E68
MATPEAEEFAALLKQLKDRSGRSYGVLATKLHVSTSTLHRYCNGDAVPNEYGTVERLARLCGATSDELVELHRRWIVAEAARRRGKPETPAADPVADAVSPAVSASVPAPEAEPEPRHGPEPEPGSGPAAEPELEPVAEAGPERERGPAPGPLGAARWRRASARTRVLLAAAAVVALTVPTAVVANQLAGASEDAAVGGPRATGPGDGDKADAVADASESASTSPSPTHSPSPSATTGSATPSARPTTSASHTSGAGPKSSTGRPPTVTVGSYDWDGPCGQYYLLAGGSQFVPPPPTQPLDNRGWGRSLKGVEGKQMRLELTVQGTSEEAVVLRSMSVRVQSQRAPLKWSAYSMGEGCGSGIEPQSFDVDLDDSRPTLTPVAGQQGDETVPAKNFPFRVSSSDVEVFDLDAHVEGHDVNWYLELAWSSGGRTGVLRIDDGGKPFRTSSIAGRPEYIYDRSDSKWVPR